MALLVDTCVLIDLSRGKPEAVAWLASLPSLPLVHTLVAAELLVGARNTADMRGLRRLLGGFGVATASPAAQALSVELVARHRLADGVGALDMLLAATALDLGASVATLNERHFRMVVGLSVVRPY